MAKVLIVYSTIEGQTAKIAREMNEQLRSKGHNVDVVDARGLSAPLVLHQYDGVIVGAPVHASRYPKRLIDWVELNSTVLSKKPSAFFSVCLGVLQKENAKVQKDEREIAERLFVRTGWRPSQWTILAGALTYSKYGWLKKRIMRSISRRAGGDTDMSRDYEYTDWNEVRKFASQFGDSLRDEGLEKTRFANA